MSKKRFYNNNDSFVSSINEPRPVCKMCSQEIDSIITAISTEDGYCHFDCVLKKLSEEYSVVPPKKISYVGSGCFAICCPDGKGNYTIEQKIQFEETESFNNMKKFVEAQKK